MLSSVTVVTSIIVVFADADDDDAVTILSCSPSYTTSGDSTMGPSGLLACLRGFSVVCHRSRRHHPILGPVLAYGIRLSEPATIPAENIDHKKSGRAANSDDF
jgi:hypothetical protein